MKRGLTELNRRNKPRSELVGLHEIARNLERAKRQHKDVIAIDHPYLSSFTFTVALEIMDIRVLKLVGVCFNRRTSMIATRVFDFINLCRTTSTSVLSYRDFAAEDSDIPEKSMFDLAAYRTTMVEGSTVVKYTGVHIPTMPGVVNVHPGSSSTPNTATVTFYMAYLTSFIVTLDDFS